jgi:hypothetical protein
MRAKRTKAPAAAPPPGEVTASDRDILIGAYKSGLIKGWKRDNEQGYRLTLSDQRDNYVAVAELPRYLEGLRKSAS